MAIVFTGFMGTGKSTLARLVGDRLGLQVLDLDDAIALKAGVSIPEIFARHGEVTFRALEHAAIASIPDDFEGIVATGGGAWLDPANRDRLLAIGPVIRLEADPAVLWERVRGSDRPLARDHEAFLALFESRREILATVPWALRTDDAEWSTLVERIISRFTGPDSDVVSSFEDHTTVIRLAPGAIARAGQWLARFHRPGPCTVVSEQDGAGRYVAPLLAGLSRAGFQPRVRWIPAGEQAKDWSVVAALHEDLARSGHERKQPIIALGGGALGDAVGFVAATYLRGVPLVQIPTTLLAQVDSSVGGKVAIDLPAGKNLVGTFFPAAQVLVDPLVLHTLGARDRASGLAEVVKMAMIEPDGWLDVLESGASALLACDMPVLVPVLCEAIHRKARIVEQDPREASVRAWLNLGHTVAHALETVLGHGTWRHGEAVSVGIVAALHLARKRDLLPENHVRRIEHLLGGLGLPVRLPSSLSIRELVTVMGRDKKVREGQIRFVLPRASATPILEILDTETLLEGLVSLQER